MLTAGNSPNAWMRGLGEKHQPGRAGRDVPWQGGSILRWTEFTGSNHPPRATTAAARTGCDFDDRTDAALSYHREQRRSRCSAAVYEDQEHRRFVDVIADHELDLPTDATTTVSRHNSTRYEIDGRRIVSDLLDVGLLEVGAADLDSTEDRGDISRHGLETGQIRLDDGRTYASSQGCNGGSRRSYIRRMACMGAR